MKKKKKGIWIKTLVLIGIMAVTMGMTGCGSVPGGSNTPPEDNSSHEDSLQNTMENGNQPGDKESEQKAIDKEPAQEPSNGTEDDFLVGLLNAPFSAVDEFDDITNVEAAKTYAEAYGYVADTYDAIPMGDLYVCYFDNEYFDEDTEKIFQMTTLQIQTGEDIHASNVSATSYSYGSAESPDGFSVLTSLGGIDGMTADNVPDIGGFADFLAGNNCLSIEAVVGNFAFADEELMSNLAKDNCAFEESKETPYGLAEISIDNYKIDMPQKSLMIVFPEGSGAPFKYITISEGYESSLIDNGTTHFLDIFAGIGEN